MREIKFRLWQHTKKPDLDNLIKLIKDACNKIIWKDDAQVVSIFAEKVYSETPRKEVIIYHEVEN